MAAGSLPEDDLFDIATQALFNAGAQSDLPEADWLLSQVPSPTEFDELEREGVPRAVDASARFGSPASSSQILEIPANTRKNTNWAVNVWNEWAEYRKRQDPLNCPPYLLTMQRCELNDWLSRFVLEVRRKDGKFYPPNTLHQLCCGVLRRSDFSLRLFRLYHKCFHQVNSSSL